MGQLREQLIGAFHEQMDVRRRLLELENQAMEVQIDTSRHLLTIAGYAFPDPGPSTPLPQHTPDDSGLSWRSLEHRNTMPCPLSRILCVSLSWRGRLAAGSMRSHVGLSSGGRSEGRNPTPKTTAKRTQTQEMSRITWSHQRWRQPGKISPPWWANRRSCASRRYTGCGGGRLGGRGVVKRRGGDQRAQATNPG